VRKRTDDFRVPPTIRDAVLERAARLSPEALRVATVVPAVHGTLGILLHWNGAKWTKVPPRARMSSA
jgi:hypothetical protein